ncbi:hypothetical protein Tco_0848180 [Tanacetum coccineum]
MNNEVSKLKEDDDEDKEDKIISHVSIILKVKDRVTRLFRSASSLFTSISKRRTPNGNNEDTDSLTTSNLIESLLVLLLSMGDLSITLHHDGVFVPNPCKYVNGRIKVLNETRFEEMQVGELFEIINKLTLSNAKHIYYCLPGTTLTLGIREIKTYSDMVEFMRLGYENDNRMELYTEHHGYDVLQYNHNDNLASDNEQSDVDPDYEGESDPENVDFHTEGEQGVEFEKLSVNDSFLNKLVEEDDPEDEIVDGMHKADKGIKYPAYNLEQPHNENKPVLGMRNDVDCLLVFYGRDLSIGRCASKKKLSNKDNLSPQGKGKGETQGNGKGEHQQKAKEKGKGKMDEQSQEKVKWTKARIKTLYSDHKCARDYNLGSLVTFRWIAQHYANEIIQNPSIPTRFMINDIREKFLINVSSGQCKRAKQLALYEHEGGLIEHYGKLWEYRQAVLESNPGSTCHIDQEVLEDDGKIHFTRMYVCFKGLKDGWLAGCRRVIGLDGCFLTHYCKGELLTAVGRDANNQMFHIEWAVVKVENKNNWCWFLSLLCDDLDLQDGLGITIISDGHKGLSEAVKTWLHEAEHRHCNKHIYANFKKKWTGVLYKRLFWTAASSTVEQNFLNHMDEIKRLDPEAYAYLMGREHGSCRLVNARGKPIITMLEDIRVYVMQRNWALSKQASELDDNICPSIRKKLNILKKQQRSWQVFPSGYQVLKVRKKDEAYGVNLIERSCVCKLWDISGIPCVHAVASYMHLHMDPDLGVSSWYSQSKWFDAYQFSIKPVSGSKMWKSTSNTHPLPPLVPKIPGRPRKKRIRHPTENDHEITDVGGSVGRGGGSTSKRGGASGLGKKRCGQLVKEVVVQVWEEVVVQVWEEVVVQLVGVVVQLKGVNSKRGVEEQFRKDQEAQREVMEEVKEAREKERLENEQYARTYCDWEDLQWEGDGFEEPNPNLRLATMSDLVAADEAHDEHFNNMPSLTNDVSLDVSHIVEANNVVVPNNEQPTPDAAQTSSQSSRVVLHPRPRSERIAKRRKVNLAAGTTTDNPFTL